MSESSSKDRRNIEDKPIPGPEHVGPDFLTEVDLDEPLSPAGFIWRKISDLVRKPAHWIRESIVEPNRGPKYYWYHRKYNRTLPIDECYLDDLACVYEANIEFRRNHLVDAHTLDLLRARRDNCFMWWSSTKSRHVVPEECDDIADAYQREEDNFFIKYGDMHYNFSVTHAYNKQKHRMIMDRRRAIAEKERQKELNLVSEAS